MAAIANLAVSVTADTQKFEKGMKDAAGSLSAFTIALGVGIERAVEFGLSMGKAAVEGLAEMAKHSAEAIDSTAKLSDALNIGTQDLRGLQFTADLAGSSAETLNSSLSKMVKNLGEATSGNETAADSFRSIGLSASVLARQDTGKSFRDIAEAIKQLPTPAERAAAAVAIFGKSGQELMATLALGRDGLIESGAEFDKLAGSVSRVDAAKVEMANDAFSKLGVVMKGVADRLAVELAPFITAASNKLIEMGFTGEALGKTLSNAFDGALQTIAKMLDGLNLLIAGWQKFGSEVSKVQAAYAREKLQIISNRAEREGGFSPEDRKDFNYYKQLLSLSNQDAAKLDTAFQDSLGKFMEGKNSKAAMNFFEDVRKNSQIAAEQIASDAAELNKIDVDALEMAEAKTKAIGQQREEVASMLALEEKAAALAEKEASARRNKEESKFGKQFQNYLQYLDDLAAGKFNGKTGASDLQGSIRQIDPALLVGVQSMAKTKDEEQKKTNTILSDTNSLTRAIERKIGAGAVTT